MEKEEYQKMYDLELNYWWFKGKRLLIQSWLNKYYPHKNDISILDVGCGTGIIMKMLENNGKVFGLDASSDAISFCKQRGITNIKKGSIEDMPFEDACFDLVTSFDMLSHSSINDDAQALKEINRILKPDGRIFFTDSAMPCLWSRHDKAFHIRERYNARELQKRLESAGFVVEKISYFNTLLFLPVFLSRKINNLLGTGPKSDIQKMNPLLNKILYFIYSFELYFLRYIRYPFGVSVFAIAKKKQ